MRCVQSFIFGLFLLQLARGEDNILGKTCPPPEAPENADAIGNNTVGSVVKFLCKEGFYRLGNPHRIRCQSNGQWTKHNVSCVAVSCGDPGSPLNGKRKGWLFQYNNSVTFDCHRGFKLEGPNARTCLANQTWSGTQPICKPVTCEEPTKVPDAVIFGGRFVFGAHVYYTCNKGYKLKGPDTLTCGEDGKWVGETPVCKVVTCADPGTPQHGSTNSTGPPFFYLSMIFYKCNDGYILYGSDRRSCVGEGNWTGVQPFCVGSTCDQPTSPHGSVIIHPTKQEKYQNGQVILFSCKQGFYLDGMPIITCNGNKWTQTQFRCLGFCPEFRNILNGKVSHVTPQVGKAAIEFRCANNSFQLVGKTRLECIDGRWNGKLPYCQKLPSCVRLQSPANGTLHGNDNSHSAEAKFTCFTGFDLFGTSTLTCNKGVWSSRVPTCKAYCTKIRDLPNGHVFGIRFSHGQEVSFNCKHGYELVGDRSLRCINGRWNSSVPQCKVMQCAKPSIPSNSRIIYPLTDQVRYTHGTTLFLACQQGHLLTGSPIMVCNYTTWLKREFRCIASCPILGPIRNGVITHVTRKSGGEVEIKCHANYTLFGSSKLSCINGGWSSSIPSCKASCKDPGNPLNGRKLGDDFRHKKTVSFTCQKNYVLEGAQTVTCLNGQWSAKKPICQDCDGPLKTSKRHISCSRGRWESYSEINLQKENTITAASIQLGRDKRNVLQIQIKVLLSSKWVLIFKPFKPSLSEGVRTMKLPQPVIAQSLQVLLITRQGLSSCLTTTLYGCEAVRRGCIMPGSAVLFKEGGKYRKGRFVSVKGVKLEIVEGKRYKYLNKDDILILDEKPNVNQLSEGTTVVGTDSRGKMKRGNIKRSCSSTYCPIETNGVEWQSKLENVRLFIGELCK